MSEKSKPEHRSATREDIRVFILDTGYLECDANLSGGRDCCRDETAEKPLNQVDQDTHLRRPYRPIAAKDAF